MQILRQLNLHILSGGVIKWISVCYADQLVYLWGSYICIETEDLTFWGKKALFRKAVPQKKQKAPNIINNKLGTSFVKNPCV